MTGSFACEDMATLRERMRQLDGDIQAHLEGDELGRLMVRFDGLGPLTVARVLETLVCGEPGGCPL